MHSPPDVGRKRFFSFFYSLFVCSPLARCNNIFATWNRNNTYNVGRYATLFRALCSTTAQLAAVTGRRRTCAAVLPTVFGAASRPFPSDCRTHLWPSNSTDRAATYGCLCSGRCKNQESFPGSYYRPMVKHFFFKSTRFCLCFYNLYFIPIVTHIKNISF